MERGEPNVFRTIERIFKRIQGVFLALTGAALGMIMCIVLLQTFTRFVIFHSLPWSEEMSRYLFVFILMIGINVAIRDDMLIRIDLIDYAANDAWRKILAITRNLIGLTAAVIIAFNATGLFRVGMIQKSPAMQIPMIIMYCLIFVGFVLASAAMFFQLTDSVLDFRNKVKTGVSERGV